MSSINFTTTNEENQETTILYTEEPTTSESTISSTMIYETTQTESLANVGSQNGDDHLFGFTVFTLTTTLIIIIFALLIIVLILVILHYRLKYKVAKLQNNGNNAHPVYYHRAPTTSAYGAPPTMTMVPSTPRDLTRSYNDMHGIKRVQSSENQLTPMNFRSYPSSYHANNSNMKITPQNQQKRRSTLSHDNVFKFVEKQQTNKETNQNKKPSKNRLSKNIHVLSQKSFSLSKSDDESLISYMGLSRRQSRNQSENDNNPRYSKIISKMNKENSSAFPFLLNKTTSRPSNKLLVMNQSYAVDSPVAAPVPLLNDVMKSKKFKIMRDQSSNYIELIKLKNSSSFSNNQKNHLLIPSPPKKRKSKSLSVVLSPTTIIRNQSRSRSTESASSPNSGHSNQQIIHQTTAKSSSTAFGESVIDTDQHPTPTSTSSLPSNSSLSTSKSLKMSQTRSTNHDDPSVIDKLEKKRLSNRIGLLLNKIGDDMDDGNQSLNSLVPVGYKKKMKSDYTIELIDDVDNDNDNDRNSLSYTLSGDNTKTPKNNNRATTKDIIDGIQLIGPEQITYSPTKSSRRKRGSINSKTVIIHNEDSEIKHSLEELENDAKQYKLDNGDKNQSCQTVIRIPLFENDAIPKSLSSDNLFLSL